MSRRLKNDRNVIRCMIGLGWCCISAAAWGQTGSDDAVVTYEQVQPVFKKHCVSCHGVERERGDLDLSSTEGIKSGSSSGPVAVPGKPEESLVFTLSAHLEAPRMPPGKSKISQRELDLIRNWIEGGMRERPAKSDAAVVGAAATKTKKPANQTESSTFTDVKPLQRPNAITALAVSPRDGNVAVSGARQIVVFAATNQAKPLAIPFPDGDVFALRYSRDGEWLLAGGGIGAESGKVVALEAATGRRLFEVGEETDAVLSFDLSPDRSLIALGGPGRTVKVYRTADRQLVHTLRKHTDWILSIAFSPDGLLIASGDRFGGLQIWETETGKPFHSLRGHVGAVNAVAWDRTADRLLSAGHDGMLRLWDLHRGQPLKIWNGEIGSIVCAEWSHADRIIAGGRSKKLAVYDLNGTSQQEWVLDDEVVELAVVAAGEQIIAGDASGHIVTRRIGSTESGPAYVLPVAQEVETSVVQVHPPVIGRKPRTRPAHLETAAGNRDKQSGRQPPPAGELDEVREALRTTEAAVQATEESLARLKSSAEALRRMIVAHEKGLPSRTDPAPSK